MESNSSQYVKQLHRQPRIGSNHFFGPCEAYWRQSRETCWLDTPRSTLSISLYNSLLGVHAFGIAPRVVCYEYQDFDTVIELAFESRKAMIP